MEKREEIPRKMQTIKIYFRPRKKKRDAAESAGGRGKGEGAATSVRFRGGKKKKHTTTSRRGESLSEGREKGARVELQAHRKKTKTLEAS